MFNYDLYFFCEKKSEKIIRDFLTKYNADGGELLVDEILVRRSIEYLPQINLHDEWVKIKDTDSWIKLGLSEQSLAFSIYYSLPTKPINGIIITFTIDGGIIFGMEAEENKRNLKYLKKLLGSLKEEYTADLTGLFVEETPSLSKDLFIESLNERAILSQLS
jgi:hypothetical protein